MIIALMIGRSGSTGFPGKNVYPILGRPLCSYPLMAANSSGYVSHIYVSTDFPKIASISLKYGAELIERPSELATKEALGEDAFAHGYREIKRWQEADGNKIELIVLLMANAATITPNLIDHGVELLRNDATIDSAVTTSVYNMWSPLRARRLGDDNCLQPFIPFEVFGDPKTLYCDCDSQGEVHFADMSVSVVRPHCLEQLENGLLPQKWMGKKIVPIPSWGGCDIDYEWQVPTVEYWLKKHGFSRASEEN